MKISDLKPNTAIDTIEVEVTEIGEKREFSNARGAGKVANAKVKDKTGTASITFWNDDIDEYKVGDKVKITDGWAKEFQSEIQMSAGKFGQIEKV